MRMVQSWCHQPWWTETNAAWVQALGLTLTLLLQLVLLYLTLREQREARRERHQDEITRQRSEVTCGGVTSIVRTLTHEQLCTHLWAGNFKHGGFAFETGLYAQLPEYLRRKCDPFIEDIARPLSPGQNQVARFLLVFRFPYPNFDAVLEDINRLNFGNVTIVWGDDGKPIAIRRD